MTKILKIEGFTKLEQCITDDIITSNNNKFYLNNTDFKISLVNEYDCFQLSDFFDVDDKNFHNIINLIYGFSFVDKNEFSLLYFGRLFMFCRFYNYLRLTDIKYILLESKKIMISIIFLLMNMTT